jgi:NAD-dependent SIR2 family protein deacetylase
VPLARSRLAGAAPGSELAAFCRRHPRLVVLTGPGCSTASGIPDYRDDAGEWKHPQPVQFQDFVSSAATRRRYWARSAIGWRRMDRARPNPAHAALASLEQHGHVELLITQNVDGLHQAAGSQQVVDLHGRLDQVRCLDCAHSLPRPAFQADLEGANPGWSPPAARPRPDGDAALDEVEYREFRVPPCPACGGRLKPDVVFFGETVPRERVARSLAALEAADALLVVGSSLMVYSGFRFARRAAELGRPIAAVNRGRTRAEELLDLKIESDCTAALPRLAAALAARTVT